MSAGFAHIPETFDVGAGRHAPLAFVFILLAIAAPVHAQPLFRAHSLQFDAGGYPTSVAVADLNGDGRPDVAVSNYSWSFSVHMGNGDGTLGVGTNVGTEGSRGVTL